MSFQLSPVLDKNKVFLVNHSELEGRLDTVFYQPKYMANEGAIKISKWGFEKVGHIAKRIADGPFGSDLKVDEYQPDGNPLLRVSNIRTGEIGGKLVYISDEKQEQLKRSKVYPGDVLLTKAGAILGYSAVFPESLKEGNITSHLVTITCRDDINPHYLSHFFRSNLGQLQIYRWGNKSTRPELNTGEVENILITTPPLKTQNEIVEKLNLAYTVKKQKEAEAQQLLDSIDDYLLAELGIKLPEQAENTVQSRIFIQQFKTITGKRLDPIFYSSDLNTFNSGLYDSQLLRVVSLSFISGVGAGKQDQSSEDMGGIIQIRPTNMDRNGGLKYDKNIYLPIDFQGTKIEVDDVLFNNTNSQELVGKTTILKEEKELFFSNHITKITVNTNIIYPDYLAIILNAYQRSKIFYSMCTNWNNQSGVGLDVLKQLKIPVPPLEKQTEIANHITQTRNQAKQLQQQAKAELEQAKKEVEAMILSEA